MKNLILYHEITVKKAIELLWTNINWLTKIEAKNRIEKYGYNKLPEWKSFSALAVFLNQFKNPLIYILLVAILISFLSKHYTDGWIILFVTLISTIVGFLQEYKANNALSQLKSLIKYKARIIREGTEHVISQDELVPGDIIILSPGDKVPADARLIEAQNFEVIESALTGESLPIEKHTDIVELDTAMADRKNMVYLWTVVSRWIAKAVVTHTGTHTEIWHIAKLVHEVEEGATPLQKQILQFGKIIGIIIIVLNVIVFALGVLMGKPILEMFLTSVSMVVAAVPEWLLPAMTIILAVGMQKLAKKKGLIRKMLATETLWAVSVICSDKTWTLTKGEMRVVGIFTNTKQLTHDWEHFSEKIKSDSIESHVTALKIWVLCNDSIVENPDDAVINWKILGNPTEKALLLAGYSAEIKKNSLEKTIIRTDSIPFESQYKYMVTRHLIWKKESIDYIKWAPEKILPIIDFVDIDGKIEKLSPKKKKEIEQQYEKLTSTWLRVIAVAYRKDTWNIPLKKEKLKEFVFVWLIALKDPLRAEVKDAIKLCQNAGMQLKVITGDHKLTTMSIVNDLGIKVSEENVIEGTALDEMSDEELKNKINQIIIFARVEPRHKIRIVIALQSHGNIVTMTWDWVNDAPALKKADIWVAVGSGTDVAKETADLVLLDDNFYTIVEAVRRGRWTFDNIRKLIIYLLSNSFTEIVLISFSVILWLPLALLPVQILWIKITTDSLPSIALAFEPVDKDIMTKHPRDPKESILSNPFKKLIGLVIIICDLSLFFIFYYSLKSTGNVIYAQTMAFVGLGLADCLYIFAVRWLSKSIFSGNPFENKLVNVSVIFWILMVVLAVYVPFLNKILHTVPLWILDWLILIWYWLLSVVAFEIGKKLFINRK